MKLEAIKFINPITIDNDTKGYLHCEANKVDMEFKEGKIIITTAKSTVVVFTSNVTYCTPKAVPKNEPKAKG